jgi:hypothetical protein
MIFVLQLQGAVYVDGFGKARIEDAFPLICLQLSAYGISLDCFPELAVS